MRYEAEVTDAVKTIDTYRFWVLEMVSKVILYSIDTHAPDVQLSCLRQQDDIVRSNWDFITVMINPQTTSLVILIL